MVVAGALAASASCASAPPAGPAATPVPTNLTAADLYPLDAGWKWAYDLEKDGQSILAMYAVLDRSPDTATVQAGDDRLSYAIDAEGIAQKEGSRVGDYVIKNPIRPGTEWIVAGGRARIAAVGQTVTVTAGKFEGCVVVEVTRRDPVRTVRTTFAPGVGPAIIEMQIQVAGEMTTVTRATLRALTRPGQDPLAASVMGTPEVFPNLPRSLRSARLQNPAAAIAASTSPAARPRPRRSSARS